jgi:transposase InsO family protein
VHSEEGRLHLFMAVDRTSKVAFDRACEQRGIEHRATKPDHLWTNGQVERMNRTLKDATARRYQSSRSIMGVAFDCLRRCHSFERPCLKSNAWRSPDGARSLERPVAVVGAEVEHAAVRHSGLVEIDWIVPTL